MKRVVNCFVGIMAIGLAVSCSSQAADTAKSYPFVMPATKPAMKMSPSMEKVYDVYGAPTPQKNELYTNFKFSMLEGLDYHDHDGTVTRRDPTRVVKANGKYYMWYTYRNTPTTFMGADKANDTIPSSDWDLCDIAYATSRDGFTWEEQGVAVPRPPKPNIGHRSVSTPDVLIWKGKYYLYYQAFSVMSGKRGDDCPVAVSVADSPDGPWTPYNKIVVDNGGEGAWDQYSIHDPQPIVYRGKIYLYFKSDYQDEDGGLIRSTGLAISDNPYGPFVKCPTNPVMSSGHETQMFRFKEGIAAILAKDGHEANTIQYSPDGVNFSLASICNHLPTAAGIYDPDAFTDTPYARGISWGISHICQWGPNRRTFLLRFDCDLSLDVDDPQMKKNIGENYNLKEVLNRSLTPKQRERIMKESTIVE